MATVPLIIERHPYRVEVVELKGKYWYESIRLDHPDRLMEWLDGPYPTECMALRAAEARLDGLLPRCVALSLTQCAYGLTELLGVRTALASEGK
jgi:hypothetical protein